MYSDYYLSSKYTTQWGDVINFDGVGAREVREFFINNACYWICEFHLDGLRLDSTQDLYDDSFPHILAELSQRVREAAFPRQIVLIAENEPQDIKLVHAKEEGGYGLDGIWNDDFHHSAFVALTGRSEAYYSDYRGVAQEFISLLKRGYLYQGQAYSWQKKSRGTIVTNEPAWCFVFYLQNHDQIANELRGERIHSLSDKARYRAMVALLLLAPETPLLFMGQEFGCSCPFMFFADHTNEHLARNVSQGRKKFLEQFESYASAYQSLEAQTFIPEVSGLINFERSKLDLTERKKHKEIYQLHRDLLKIRREDPVIGAQNRFQLDGAVLNSSSFLIRFFGKQGDDRLLLINLGPDLEYHPLAEPLLAPSKRGHWEMIWSSNNPIYGGPGAINPCKENGWKLSAHSAILLKSVAEQDKPRIEKRYKQK
jgi:maltooligosyltrehalose trehalohydrolase